MTRLSDALKRAAATADTAAPEPAGDTAGSDWQFAASDVGEPQVDGTATSLADATPAVHDAAPVTEQQSTSTRNAALRVGDADRHKLVTSPSLEPALVEQYRHLAAVLHHAQERSAIRSVMVTSAVPNEGKTLTATNLALTLSESYQRRVLLIDADLRRPRLREMFALPTGDGLINVLVSGAASRLPIHRASPTLSILTSGSVVDDPMSLLASAAMKQLLDEARSNFDWVVVDTPPIAILPDANLLSAMIDTALLVVSAESTPYPMVQRAADAIGKGRILGVVLNRAEQAAMPAYDYGYPGLSSGRVRQPRRWWQWRRRREVAVASAIPASPSGR